MPVFQQYSDRTSRAIRDVLEQEKQRKTFRVGSRQTPCDPGDPAVRWVRTTTNEDFPTYPTAPHRKFVVEFGDYTFDDTDIDGDDNDGLVFEPWEPLWTKIAYSHVGWLPEGLIVRATKHRGMWHIQPDQFGELKAVVAEDGGISANGSGDVTIWLAGAASEWTVTAHLNWMHGGRSVEEGKEVLIRWFPDEEKWVIVEVEC